MGRDTKIIDLGKNGLRNDSGWSTPVFLNRWVAGTYF